MIPVSTDFSKFIYDAGRELLARVEADLANGTHLTLNSYDLMENGLEIEDAVSESGKFQVGAAIINQLTLELNNFADKEQGTDFSGVDFTGATLRPYIGLVVKKDWTGDTVEWVPKGIFTAEKPTAAGGRTTVTAPDNMAKLDTAYSKSTLTYPATLGQIAADACSVCGVTLATTTFLNSTYSVAKRPTSDSMTCREILSYVAQLAGCFARCNTGGAVEIRWYAGDTVYDVGAGSSSSSTADADTVITGVQIQGSDDAHTVYRSGTDGFVVRIQDNPLAQENLQAVADTLGTMLNGYTFRAYTASSPSNPAIEAGDVVNTTDGRGITRKTIVSRLTYSVDGAEEYNADAETPAENQSERFTAAQKAQETADKAQAGVEEAKTEITQLNGQIILKADKGSLIAEINISPESIKISADKLELSGLVTITSLKNGTTTIDGSCIRTGKISADRIDTEELSAGKLVGEDYPDTYVRIGSNPQTTDGHGMSIISDGATILGFYADGGGGAIGYTSGTLQIVAEQSLGFTCDPDGEIALGPNVELEGDTTVDGSINFKGDVRVDGDNGFSGSTVLKGRDGSDVGLTFKNGILVDTY